MPLPAAPLVRRLTPERRLAALIAIALAARIVFATSLGLGMDEAYTVATARDFVLSAFDHPPAAWWLATLGHRLFGDSDLALRLPFILLSGLTLVMMFLLGRRLFGAEAGFWASFALCCAPVLGVIDASWILPDAPLLPALLAGAWALSHAFFDETPSRAPLWWLLAGLFSGLAMLSKYHGVFLPAGAFLFMILSPRHRRWLTTPWPWLAGLVALALFSPVLVWNAQHDWASFLFQSGRTGEPRLNLAAPFILLGMQSLFLLPWIHLPCLALLARALWRGPAQERDFLLACLAVGPIVLFTLPAFWSAHRMLPHWAAPGYLLLLPLLGREIADLFARDILWIRRATAGAVGLIAALILLLAGFAHLPLPAPGGARYPLLETLDWTDFSEAFFARNLRDQGDFIAATRWFEAGKIDAALGGAFPVLCLSNDPRGFGATRDPQKFVGRDALIVGRHLTREQAYQLYEDHFDAIVPLSPIAITANGATAFDLKIFKGRNFHDPAPEFSLGIQSGR
jgi:4-amino-4-deoxy-L-arabinose transferase-like glycosyltransferase